MNHCLSTAVAMSESKSYCVVLPSTLKGVHPLAPAEIMTPPTTDEALYYIAVSIQEASASEFPKIVFVDTIQSPDSGEVKFVLHGESKKQWSALEYTPALFIREEVDGGNKTTFKYMKEAVWELLQYADLHLGIKVQLSRLDPTLMSWDYAVQKHIQQMLNGSGANMSEFSVPNATNPAHKSHLQTRYFSAQMLRNKGAAVDEIWDPVRQKELRNQAMSRPKPQAIESEM